MNWLMFDREIQQEWLAERHTRKLALAARNAFDAAEHSARLAGVRGFIHSVILDGGSQLLTRDVEPAKHGANRDGGRHGA